jgi:hypothetical protein
VGIRPIYCARPRARPDEKEMFNPGARDRQGSPIPFSDTGFFMADPLVEAFQLLRARETCQLEHRLVAQPFDDEGKVLDFAIHLIHRPFAAGEPNGFQLAKQMLNDVIQIKNKFKVTNEATFGIYPGSQEETSLVKEWNQHILKFYGGEFLRTTAILVSSGPSKHLYYSGGTLNPNPEENQKARFNFANLIRPPTARNRTENDHIQVIDTSNPVAPLVTVFESNGEELDPGIGDHYPGLKRFLENPNSAENQQEALDLENLRRFELPNTDCMSCHHLTAQKNLRKLDLKGMAFDTLDQTIVVKAKPNQILQDSPSHFVNFGYAPLPQAQGEFLNRPSVSQHTINHAALSTAILRKFVSLWQ